MLGADEPRLSRNVPERRRRRPRATALSARATVNPWVTPSSEPSAQAPGLRESPRQDETPSGKPRCFRWVEAKLLTLRQTYPPPPSCLGSARTLGGGRLPCLALYHRPGWGPVFPSFASPATGVNTPKFRPRWPCAAEAVPGPGRLRLTPYSLDPPRPSIPGPPQFTHPGNMHGASPYARRCPRGRAYIDVPIVLMCAAEGLKLLSLTPHALPQTPTRTTPGEHADDGAHAVLARYR